MSNTDVLKFRFGRLWWRHQMETFSALLAICTGNSPVTWIKGWVNHREAGDLRRYRAHYDVTVIPNCQRMSDYSSIGMLNFACIVTVILRQWLSCHVTVYWMNYLYSLDPGGQYSTAILWILSRNNVFWKKLQISTELLLNIILWGLIWHKSALL